MPQQPSVSRNSPNEPIPISTRVNKDDPLGLVQNQGHYGWQYQEPHRFENLSKTLLVPALCVYPNCVCQKPPKFGLLRATSIASHDYRNLRFDSRPKFKPSSASCSSPVRIPADQCLTSKNVCFDLAGLPSPDDPPCLFTFDGNTMCVPLLGN